MSHHDHLEFLEDVIPKTVPYKKIKATANATQARLRGENVAEDRPHTAQSQTNGSGATIVNGERSVASTFSVPLARTSNSAATEEDPSEQLELEMRQAQGSARDTDVQMTG